ncbi:hypothetical protein BGZ60DRAFT_525947 [Tricladium varicosporioides]|nr:hypothetical protein BGZ60DRAFT_525947 [Hymenoscyphus varicosporioides]
MYFSMLMSSPLAALFPIVGLHNVYAQQLNTMCWYKTDNTKHSSLGGPSGVITPNSNYISCCAISDTCVGNGICHYTHPKPLQGSVTGYYVGGCNDPSLSPSNCNMHCSSFENTDIVYNFTTNTWNCCGVTNSIIHCDDPTSEAFSAPAPAAMVATYTVQSAVSTAITTSAGSTSIPTPTRSGAGEKYIPMLLSTSARAGIGIGASICGLTILALTI